MRPDLGIKAAAGLIEVSGATQEALLRDLEARVGAGRGFAVATLNLDHIVKLRRQPEFRSAYVSHTHVVADGNPVVWLHRLAGRRVHLITGSDLVDPLMELAAQQGVPVAFFGSTPTALDAAAAELAARYPGLTVICKLSPSAGFDPMSDEADAAANVIAASGAGICLVALGAPKQEIFAARAHERMPHVGFVSVGAGLDFIAGTQKRAPLLMRRLALEWLWRLASDRRRLARRYLDCAAIFPGLVAVALRARFTPRAEHRAVRPPEYTSAPPQAEPEPMDK